MMDIGIYTHDKQVVVGMDLHDLKFRRAMKNGLYEIGEKNVRYAKKEILKRNKTGRLYKINGRLHRASAPGEFPANLTGELRKSLNYTVRGGNEMEFGARAKHGKFLEKGTKNMKVRPFLEPTVRHTQIDLVNVINHNINEELKGNR